MAIKPHDPNRVPDAAKLKEKLQAILAEPTPNLNVELEQLSRAHAVLRDAMQEN